MKIDPQDPAQVQSLLDDLEFAGVSCFLKGNFPDAIKVFAYGLSVCEHVYGVESHSQGQLRTTSMLLNLGITLGKVGEYTEAEPYLRRALGKHAPPVLSDKDGVSLPEARHGTDALAYLLIESGRIEEAVRILERRFREGRPGG